MNRMNSRSLKIRQILPLLMVYGVMVVLALAANIINPGFLSPDNMYSILKQIAFLGIACIGQTFVILTGGIDLSLRYMILFSNVLAAQMINGQQDKTWSVFALILLISVGVGIVNGFGVHFLRIPAMVMTLATGTVLYGATLLYCKGAPGGHASDVLSAIANRKLFGMMNGVTIIWIVLAAAAIVLLHNTTFGRSVYALGTNPEGARYAGIRTSLVMLSVYVIAAATAGVTGFLFLGYTESGYLSTASSYNMDSIAAVVVGGTSIMGGRGGYTGTIAGVGIMMILNSLMTILHMAEAGKQVVQGLLIIVLLVVVYGRRKER